MATSDIKKGPLYVDSANNRVGIGTSSPSELLHLNRETTDGDIVAFAKDGSTVGSIGTDSGDLTIDGAASHTGLRFISSYIQPRLNGSVSNGGVDLGHPAARFKDLYLSGGVYLGGTGSANYLDDYEEGTWTLSTVGGTGVSATAGLYTKVGRLVTFNGTFTLNTNSSGAHLTIQGLPFTSNANTRGAAMIRYTNYSETNNFSMHVNGASDSMGFYRGSGPVLTESQFSGKRCDFAGFYYT